MNKSFLLILCPVFFFISCEEKQSASEKNLLIGSWVFQKGIMNGSEEDADLLQNLVLEFTAKNFKCELLPEMQKGFEKEVLYVLKNDQIIIGKILLMDLIKVTPENLLIEFELNEKDKINKYNLQFSRIIQQDQIKN